MLVNVAEARWRPRRATRGDPAAVRFGGLRLRSIGPASASGRVTSFAVNPENPAQYFVGVASGGVWKTVNNGITWTPGL